MVGLAIYDESKVKLGPVQFLNDALSHVCILDMDSFERTKQLSLAFTTIAEAMKVTNPITDFDKKEIKELVLRRFKRLSVNEIYYAFKLERFGEYEERTPHYNRFDTVYVSKILEKYKNWKISIKQQYNLKLSNQIEEKTISESEKRKIIFSGVIRIYEEYKKTKLVNVGATHIYDILYQDGLLPTDAETKRKIYEEAKIVLANKISELNAKNLKEREEVKEVIRAIREKRSPKVVVQAKNIMIHNFFIKISNDKDLEKKFFKKYSI